jgi:hypothetical protein
VGLTVAILQAALVSTESVGGPSVRAEASNSFVFGSCFGIFGSFLKIFGGFYEGFRDGFIRVNGLTVGCSLISQAHVG